MSKLGDEFAKQLKDLRAAEDKSQEWLAGIGGISRATVNRWENHGAGSATLDEVERFSAKLKKAVPELLGLSTHVQRHSLADEVRKAITETLENKSHWTAAEPGLHSLHDCLGVVSAASGSSPLVPAELLAAFAKLDEKSRRTALDVFAASVKRLGASKSGESQKETG